MGEMGEIEAEKGPEDRASPRTNLLLAANAEVGGRILPVRIRNLSETGAMLEGAGLPDAGMKLVLVRGDLHVAAVVAWAAGGRRGVMFEGPTPVHEWTGGTNRWNAPAFAISAESTPSRRRRAATRHRDGGCGLPKSPRRPR
jgi:hypothetical protein